MVTYRVLRNHTFKNDRGQAYSKTAGDLVNIVIRKEAEYLLNEGIIGDGNESHNAPTLLGTVAKQFTKTLRIGVWIRTSNHYSGGRIHLYQYAWTMANLGAEVYLITNSCPKWAADYPEQKRLKIIIEKKDSIPADIDIIMTDSKDGLGKRALQWSQRNPQTKFICLNFETANWASSIYPPLGKRMQPVCNVYKFAHYLLANSNESGRWLQKAMDEVGAGYIPIGIFPPGTNNYSMARSSTANWAPPERPYAFYAARGCDYKKVNIAIAAMKAVPFPFDLVMMGQNAPQTPHDPNHTIHVLQGASDEIKYAALKHAVATFTPSLFEGYGMVPGESLCSGTPVIAFDLPVLRQEYGDKIIYAKHGDVKAFVDKVKKYVPKWVKNPPKINTKKMVASYGMKRLEDIADKLTFHTIRKKKITAQLISYYGFIPESILSVAPYINELTIAFGKVPLAPHIEDGSKERLQKVLAELPKNIKVKYEERSLWDDKRAMRKWCCDQMTGNHLLLLDGDEIWDGVENLLTDDKGFPAPRWVNFWHDQKHWIYDDRQGAARWGVNDDNAIGSVCRHYRYSWWRPTYWFRQHPSPVDSGKKALFNYERAISMPSACTIYHLGHSLPQTVMDAKHQLYTARDKGKAPERQAAWNMWKGEIGNTKDGRVEKVNWKLPALVKTAFKNLGK